MSLLTKAFFTGVNRVFSLPRLSIPLILTLGLTLGAVLTVIAISSTLLYQPLQGIKNESQLQTFEYRFKMSESLSVSYWNMHRLAAFSKQFSDVGEWAGINADEQDILINDTLFATTRFDASNNILSVLGTQLLLGEDVTIDSPNKYVWLSNSLWQSAFLGMESAIGKQTTINNQQYIIAGVIEDVMAIKSEQAILSQQVWFINDLTTINSKPDNVGNISNEIDFLLLKSTNGQATLPTQEETDAWLITYIKANVADDLTQMYLDFLTNTETELIGNPYRDNMLGDNKALIVALFAAVFGLLLMATLNLLNLFIAHYQGRTKEFSVQISLGASLFKVRLLVLIENLPSFILAAIAGLLVAGWALKGLPLIAGDTLPLINSIGINASTISASFIIIVLLSILFSSLALVDINKQVLASNLNSSGKGTQAQSNQWLSRALMVLQLSIASLLLTASVMLTMQSYQAVYQDLGYDIGNSYNINLSLTDEEYITQLNDYESYGNSEVKQLLSEMANSIKEQVSDSNVIVNSYGPLSSTMQVNAFIDESNGGKRIIHQMKNLSANFFSTFKIPMLAGANLTQAQIDNDEYRIVIDQTMATLLFPSLSLDEVIGKTIQRTGNADGPLSIINGIVGDTTSRTGITSPLGFPSIYSHRINIGSNAQFTVIMPKDKKLTLEMLTSEFQQKYPRFTNMEITPLTELWETQTLNQRISLWVVILMTSLTLFLAAIGVAGLTQMTTNHRKYELAVRMATGAKQLSLVKFILKDALTMLIIGLGLGFIISVFTYQYLQQTIDVLPDFNWLAMSLLDMILIVIVMMSVILPAWQVIKADPMQALRQE
jgi:predicted permease